MSDIEGLGEFVDVLNELREGSILVGQAAAAGIAGTLTKAIRDNSPGDLRNKIGFSLTRSDENQSHAVVGFGIGKVLPRRGRMPRSLTPNVGKNTRMTQICQTAIGQTLSAAISAGETSAKARITSLVEKG